MIENLTSKKFFKIKKLKKVSVDSAIAEQRGPAQHPQLYSGRNQDTDIVLPDERDGACDV